MGQLLVRNVDDDLIRRLKERAAVTVDRQRRSSGSFWSRPCVAAGDFAERAARWRRLTAGRETTDSAELIRADDLIRRTASEVRPPTLTVRA